MRVTINRLNVLADALLNNAPSWIDSTLDITSNDDETQLEIDVDYFVFKIRRPRTPILSWWSDGVDGTKQMSGYVDCYKFDYKPDDVAVEIWRQVTEQAEKIVDGGF